VPEENLQNILRKTALALEKRECRRFCAFPAVAEEFSRALFSCGSVAKE
jgi:hypothetical protein